eukprot:EG_transcript_21017
MDLNPCREFVARPLEDNVFEWLFTLRGPDDTEYANGFYRGRIILQSNYPFFPPDIELLTPNGRFELNKKICLSISSYHPENWHPTWGIKTVLHALREFMSTPGNNAIGAIEYSKEKRQQLARESHDFICPILKVPITDDIMLMNASPASVETKPPPVPDSPDVTKTKENAETPESNAPTTTDDSLTSERQGEGAVLDNSETSPSSNQVEDGAPAEVRPAVVHPPQREEEPRPQQPRQRRQPPNDSALVIVISESFLNRSIAAVTVAILAILAHKALISEWLNVL